MEKGVYIYIYFFNFLLGGFYVFDRLALVTSFLQYAIQDFRRGCPRTAEGFVATISISE